jgi:predicted membrane protein
LAIGLLVVAAGGLLAAFNSGALPAESRRVVFSLPMLLVAAGVATLLGERRGVLPGAALVVVGGVLLLRRMEVAAGYLSGENIWAAVLVVAGGLLVAKACFLKRRGARCCGSERREERLSGCHARRAAGESRSFSDYLERTCVFGGARERVESQSFSGGEVSCVFGSVELDFTSAQLAEGVSYLEVSAVFGGVELYIPSDWYVEVRPTNIFGGFVDRRTKATFDVADNRKLVLVITSVFGGGEIKSHA